MKLKMINKFSDVPAYIQIEKIISEKILQGDFLSGELIPSELILAKQYQVSRMTVRKAIDYLVRQGKLYRIQGKGTFVCPIDNTVKMCLPLDKHITSSEVAKKLKLNITNKLISLQKINPSNRICRQLNIDSSSFVWYMKRLRLIDNIPFVFETSYMIVEPYFLDLTEMELNRSKYDYICSKSLNITRTEKNINGELPNEEVRVYLGLKRDEPVLHANSIAFLEKDIPFEVSEIYYNQKHYTFTVEATRFIE